MSIFSDNIRFLRNKRNLSQQGAADHLGISRVRYSKYEDGRSEPPFDVLVKISKLFSVSIDLMLTVDVRKYSLEDVIPIGSVMAAATIINCQPQKCIFPNN